MPAQLPPLDDTLPLDVDGNFKQRNTQKQADALAQFQIDQDAKAARALHPPGRTIDHGEETIDASGTTVGQLYKTGTSSPMELLGQKLDEPGSVVRDTITGKNDATGLDVAKAALPNVANLGPSGQAAAGFVAGAITDPLNFVNPGGAAKGAAGQVSRMLPKASVAPTFYSPLQRFIASGKVGNTFTPDQLRGQLAKNGISESEIHWSGLEDALEGKAKVSKQEVLDHLAQNEIQVQDVVKDESGKAHQQALGQEWGRINQAIEQRRAQGLPVRDQLQRLQEIEAEQASTQSADAVTTKFGDPRLQLPGGENYREVLLTLPQKREVYTPVPYPDSETSHYTLQLPNGEILRNMHGAPVRYATQADAEAAAPKIFTHYAQERFTQGHFDEPNVMAHLRLTDRTIGGKKALFIEEAQSDWDLLARKEGVKDPNADTKLLEVKERLDSLERERRQWFDDGKRTKESDLDFTQREGRLTDELNAVYMAQESAVPDFPFRGKWHELAIKRVLRMAAEEGYDSVAWTTGQQQAERYNLQKHVKAISYKVDDTGTYHLVATMPNGSREGIGQVTADRLTETVGKDVAQRIHEGKGNPPEDALSQERGWKELSGLDLKLGGEGKNTLYDEIIPKFLNKYGQRWNARAGTANIRTGDNVIHGGPADGMLANPYDTPVHHFPITDSLRKSVMEDGQSMFGTSFQAVHDFVGTLDPKTQNEIVTALQGADAPKWLKRLQGEEGGIQTAAAWLLTRMAMGFTAGALVGDPEHVIENGLMGAGLFSLASPKIVNELARIVRRVQPNPAVDMNPQAAQAAGHTVGEVGHVPVDWDAVEATAQGARALIQKVADNNIKANGGKRGHIPNEVTLQAAEAMGMHVDEFERWMSTEAGVAMSREELAYGALTLRDSQRTNIPAKIAAYAKAGAIPGSPEERAALNALALHDEIRKQFMGGREEAGGALQIMRTDPAREAVAWEKAIASEAENAGLTSGELPKGAHGPEKPNVDRPDGLASLGLDNFIKIWKAAEDKGALERVSMQADKINGWDMLNELVYGDALSSPETHIANLLTSSGLNPVASVMIRGLASMKARLLGDASGVVPGEAMSMMHGYFTGVHSALKTVRDTYHEGGFMQLWSDLHSLEERGKLEGSGKKAITSDNLARILGSTYGHDIHIPYNKPYSFDPNGYIGKAVDIFGTAIRTPSQLLKVGDRFSYAINFHMSSEAAAWRKAVQSGGDDPQELASLYQQNLARMPQDIRNEAERFAKHEIFQEAITGYPGKLVEGMGHPILRPFITFVRTPIDIMKYNLEGTPLANRLVKSVRDDYAAGGARAQLAQAKMILGGSITGLAGIMAWSGRLTGAGPEDPSVRKVWLDAGNQPYSLNVGTDTKPIWLSYRWAEPFATWGGMAADAVYGWHHEASDVQSFIYGVLPTVAMNSFTNKTWTKDAMELFGALKSQAGDTPETKAARWEAYAKSRVKALVPGASGLAAVARATDPVMHEALTLWETLKKGIPGLSSTLPPSYDLKGNVRTREDLGPDIISPIAIKSGKPDKVLTKLWENGVGEPPFPKYVGGLAVTAKEKSRLQYLRATLKDDQGRTLYENLKDVTNTPEFRSTDLTAEGRKAMLAPVLHAYTNMALAEAGRTNSKFSKEREAIFKAHKKGYAKDRSADDFNLNP